ncbi:MAG: hypothetical protein AAF600_20790 [Bacteroidota bacterium]
MQGFRADASIFGALKKLEIEIFQLVTGTSATSFAADRSISIHLPLAACLVSDTPVTFSASPKYFDNQISGKKDHLEN